MAVMTERTTDVEPLKISARVCYQLRHFNVTVFSKILPLYKIALMTFESSSPRPRTRQATVASSSDPRVHLSPADQDGRVRISHKYKPETP
ncbi:hypothetical protein PoB_001899300 [Plakobranchus ocellatus]|uniref:Uncharacterized protein n=1 Tax=Plakobranchus ocellatus TaxID=259542 RepID=A0AAV3ZD39_9GAST|nr:hypothetical protein PoB_001899300 [Plakobranchus ocellatus]